MEIADYLNAARRRWWVLILVPLLAAGAALAYALTAPKTYSATATVLTPGLVGTPYSQFTGPQATAQFVSAFAASAADPTVIAATAKGTGVSDRLLASNVTIAQVGASSNVTLTYSGQSPTASSLVAQTLARNALKNIYTAQGQVANTQVDAAKKAVDAANQAVGTFVAKAGVGEPSAAYQAAVSQVAWLQQTQADYVATDLSTSASLIQPAIVAAQKRVSTIGAMLPTYNNLLSAQKMATETYQSVLGDQRKVQAQEAAATAVGVVQTSGVTPDVTRASIAKLVVPVAGAAVILAIIFLALFEFMAAVRRQPVARNEPTAGRHQPSGKKVARYRQSAVSERRPSKGNAAA